MTSGGSTNIVYTDPTDLAERPFNEYTLTRIVERDVGLYPLSSAQMYPLRGPIVPTSGLMIGDGAAEGAVSYHTPIGFTLKFNGILYTKFMACSSGWLALIDPQRDLLFTSADVMSDINDNTTILSTFGSNSVLLCPWFDYTCNTCNSLNNYPGSLDSTDKDKILKGYISPPQGYDQIDFAVKYRNVVSSAGERCLVVRWSSFSRAQRLGSASDITAIKYEVVLYESGKIEFRYAPRDLINVIATSDPSNNEGATIGVFNNLADWKFRDFAVGLGHPSDSFRQRYELGGALYDAAFADPMYDSSSTTPYVSSLFACRVGYSSDPNFQNRISNWPGQKSSGCIMSFDPPKERRKVLPRRELRNDDSRHSYPTIGRTGDVNRPGTENLMFDDRRTLNYVDNVIVDYPTTLPRTYANTELAAVDRLNVYGNFGLMTSSTSRCAAEQYIANEPVTYVSSFDDAAHPEQSQSGEFFSGSSMELFGNALKQPITSKTQIQFELPLHYSLVLPTTQSSMYYYNVKTMGWLLPQNSQAGADIVDPKIALSTGSTANDMGRFMPEDARGFGPFGNTIVSGTNPGVVERGWQSDDVFGFSNDKIFDMSQQVDLLERNLGKSVQNNPEYVATSDEQFTLPINQPFLVEKVVFEFPFAAGSGWLNDRTTSTTPVKYMSEFGSYACEPFAFNVGGPALTISLFNQMSGNLKSKTSGSSPYESISRDLITSGTIIPVNDNCKNVILRYTSLNNPEGNLVTYMFEPEGYLSFGFTPSTIVTPVSGTFTGSVTVNTVAGVSNGLILCQTIYATNFYVNHATLHASASLWSSAITNNYLTSPYLSLTPWYDTGNCYAFYNVQSANTLGRNEKGFAPTGRSLFGKEFVTLQRYANNNSIPNPIYVSSSFSALPSSFQSALSDEYFNAFMQIAVPAMTSIASPYLVLPGDKLTLAISKTRPAMVTNGTDPFTGSADVFRSAARHDVTLPSGSIRVTMYGSLVSEDREFHDNFNQELCTLSIHEHITSPALDQFEVENRDSFFGTYTDDYVTGSLTTKEHITGILTTATDRGKVFSRLDARHQSKPVSSPTSSYEVQYNPSKSFRQQPWYENCGEQRFVRHVTNGERFYDSMLPNILDCLDVDATPIYQYANMSIDLLGECNDATKRYGTMIFDGFLEAMTTGTNVVNRTWSRSFPFESRYDALQRQLTFNKNMLIDHIITDPFTFGSSSTTQVSPIVINEFIPMFMGAFDDVPMLNVACDVALNKTMLVSGSTRYVTGSMSQDDTIKTMYGFGDKNTMICLTGTLYAGSNHVPTYRDYELLDNDYSNFCSISPIIRGWKYGIYNGLATNSSIVYRRGRYGHFRDMLEQRLFTKFYQTEQIEAMKTTLGVTQGPVNVKFVDIDGKLTNPENTLAQNLSIEATSSVPYFDRETRNRTIANVNTIDQSIITFNSDQFGNVTL